jgi:hypothetical protein
MADIAELRSRLRQEVHDEEPVDYRWQDDTLDRHLLRATNDLSLVWPRERKATLATNDGSRELSLASLQDLVRVEAVEYPAGRYPAEYVRFSVFAGVLTLQIDQLPGGAEDVHVYWGKLHTLSDTESTIPPVAQEAVVTGAAGYAALEWAGFATNRANIGGNEAVEQYRRWGEAQLQRFRSQLSRFGDNARLRTSTLFSPAHTRPGNIVDWEL